MKHRAGAVLLISAVVLLAAGPSLAYYHPTLGRWVARDPSGYADGMSLYEYVRSSPSTERDPSGQQTEDECLRNLAQEVNNLITFAGQMSAFAKRQGRDRGDAGRLSQIVRSADETVKWHFNVHFVSDLEKGAAGVSLGVLPFGTLSRQNYANNLGNKDRCRGVGSLLETNIHEAIHQKQQGVFERGETLKPARQWKPSPDPSAPHVGGGPQRDVGNYADQIAQDMVSVLNLSPEERLGFTRKSEECKSCCELLREMIKSIKDREIARYPYWK